MIVPNLQFKSSHQIYCDLNQLELEIVSYEMGLVHQGQKQLTLAKQEIYESLQKFHLLESRLGCAHASLALGNICKELGQREESFAAWSEAARFAEEIGQQTILKSAQNRLSGLSDN